MEPASKRPMVSADDAGVVLSQDLLWEILLRVPAKPLCLFRAVCRPWRSLLSDPSFAKAHAAVHPDLIVSLAGDNDRIDMTDLSGNVVRQISISPEDVGVHHNPHPAGPFYLLQHHNRVSLFDLDTGGVSTLPLDDLQRRVGLSFQGSYALGRVASTGQHKLLRVVSRYNYPENRRIEQHCDVFTLGDDRWRPMASAPLCVKFHSGLHHIVAHNAVIQGVVYFLPDSKFPSFDILGADSILRADNIVGADNFLIDTNCVMSFDLEAEEWRPATVPGPPEINNTSEYCRLKLAKLKGSLVMLRHSHGFSHDHPTVEMDMWFATDLEKGVWVKEHKISLELPMSKPCMFAPDVDLLMVLGDGRVVFYYSGNWSSGNWSWPEPDWRTRIYDPRTKSCTDVPQHGVRYIAGIYRQSMLSLGSR